MRNCTLVQVRSPTTMLMLTVVRLISQLSMSGSNIATSFGSEITVCKEKFTKVIMPYIIIQTISVGLDYRRSVSSKSVS